MYSKFQFFPLTPVTPPGQCQKFPVPADPPALSLSQSFSYNFWSHHEPWPGSCLMFGSSLVTPAVFPPSGIVKDPSLCLCQEEVSPFRSAVTPQFSPWSLMVFMARNSALCRISQCHLHPGGAEHCLLWKPLFYYWLFLLETHQILKPLSLEREPGVCPGFHLTALY